MFTGRRRKRLSSLSSIDPHPGVLRSNIKYEAVTTVLIYDQTPFKESRATSSTRFSDVESGDITRLREIRDELGWIRATLKGWSKIISHRSLHSDDLMRCIGITTFAQHILLRYACHILDGSVPDDNLSFPVHGECGIRQKINDICRRSKTRNRDLHMGSCVPNY